MRLIIIAIFISYINCGYAQKDFTPNLDSLTNWVNTRIENAANGRKEKVKMVLVVRTLGWGCRCPDYFIGVSTSTQEGPFINVIAPINFPTSDTIGYSLIVEGYFTGKKVQLDLRMNEDEPEEWNYLIPEFMVTKWKLNKKEYDRKWFELK